MRCIDADELKTHEQLEPMGNGMYEYVQVVYKDDIDDAPTIEPRCEECEAFNKARLLIPQPERKGKWILITDNNGQHYICDHCGEWRCHQHQKFCGECGLKMEECEDTNG